MIRNQQSFNLSPYMAIYDLVVPKDNLLRQMNELIDFSFIYDEIKDKYCLDNGRNAIPPVRMFKYLLLKVIFDLSDVDVVERSKYDMSFKYFLDMAPEEPVINPSSLTKFRRLRLKDANLLDLLIAKSVELALQHNIIKKKTIIVDSTHTAARYSSKSMKEVLQEKAKQLRKTIYQYDESMKGKLPDKPTSSDVLEERQYCEELIYSMEKEERLMSIPAVKEKVNVLKELVEDEKEQRVYYSNDPDARTGHKSEDRSFYGYKTHIALSDERIITAAVVTPGDHNDGKLLKTLVEKTKQAGMDVETVIGDSAYSGRENLEFGKQEDIKIVSKLHPVITNGARKKEEKFQFNKDANTYVCPAGHTATKALVKKRAKNRNTQLKYYFDVEKCKVCPLRDGCYKEGAKTKTYSVTIKSPTHQEQENFQNTKEFKELAKLRYKIEAKNAELKNRHGLKKANTSGLFGMQIQGATTIFAVNIKRIIKLMNTK